MRGEADGDGVNGGKVKDDFFTGSDPKRRNKGTGDDNLTGAERLAENGEKVCDVAHEVNEFAS